MEPLVGIEPTTYSLRILRANCRDWVESVDFTWVFGFWLWFSYLDSCTNKRLFCVGLCGCVTRKCYPNRFFENWVLPAGIDVGFTRCVTGRFARCCCCV